MEFLVDRGRRRGNARNFWRAGLNRPDRALAGVVDLVTQVAPHALAGAGSVGAGYGVSKFFKSRKRRGRPDNRPWKTRRIGKTVENEEKKEASANNSSLRKRMAYGKRRGKKRQRYRRRRSTSRRRKYPRRRKATPSRTRLRAKLQDLLSPPRTLKMAHSQFIESQGVTNEACWFTSHALNGWYGYNKLYNSTGQNNEPFFLEQENSTTTCVWASQLHRIRNNTDYPVYIQATVYKAKYGFRDSDYTYGRHSEANSMMEIMYRGMIAELDANDDALITKDDGDSTNNRHYAKLYAPNFAQARGKTFNELFKPVKKYKTRKLDAGDCASFKLVDKAKRKIIGHVHCEGVDQGVGNSTNHFFAGRTEIIVFKVWGTVVGTAEAAGANENDKKVSSSTYQVMHEIFDTYTVKSIEPTTSIKEWIENRPQIAESDQRGMVDEQMNLDNDEHL